MLWSVSMRAGEAHTACRQGVKITHYAAEDYPGWTADGSTTTWGALGRGERLVAADYWLPMGAQITIDGDGPFTVRDRGNLAAYGVGIDVLVATHDEAIQRGTYRAEVCW